MAGIPDLVVNSRLDHLLDHGSDTLSRGEKKEMVSNNNNENDMARNVICVNLPYVCLYVRLYVTTCRKIGAFMEIHIQHKMFREC